MRFAALCVMAVACGSSLVAVAQIRSSPLRPSSVDCAQPGAGGAEPCRVDLATYVGWRVFQSYCAACHGEDALGSSFAPELGPRIRRMSWRDFAAVLDTGYAGLGASMPAWTENREVVRYYPELWSYLEARASGALPPGPMVPRDDPQR